jgi:hypothetical protein
MSLNTAVALMVFNRPEKTSRVLAEIMSARPLRLYVVADGARDGNAMDEDLVWQTREVIERQAHGLEVTQIYSNSNLGLRERFLTGLDQVFVNEERLIVLEDDCLPSQSFFRFVDDSLRNPICSRLGVISGSNFAPYSPKKASYHLSTSPYIWGWGTWASVWREFRSNEQRESWSEEEIQSVIKGFSVKGQAKEFESLMQNAHKLNTWDVSFAVWLRQNQLLTAVPARNLIQNIGFGVGATHTLFENFDVDLPAEELDFPLLHPSSADVDIRREKIMWLKKQSRWVTFPFMHPIDFAARVFRFLKLTTGHRATRNNFKQFE